MDNTKNPFRTTDQFLEWLSVNGPEYADIDAALEMAAANAAAGKIAVSGRRLDTGRRETIPAIEWADLRIGWDEYRGDWLATLPDLPLSAPYTFPGGLVTYEMAQHATPPCWCDLRFDIAGPAGKSGPKPKDDGEAVEYALQLRRLPGDISKIAAARLAVEKYGWGERASEESAIDAIRKAL